MNKRIVFRKMDHSPSIEAYANQQLAKIEKFLENERTPQSIDLTLESGVPHAHHRVELLVKTPHYDLISSFEGPQWNDVLDRVIDTMYRKLHEAKRKMVAERKPSNRYGQD